MSTNRVRAGVPAGGQFAAGERAEAAVCLNEAAPTGAPTGVPAGSPSARAGESVTVRDRYKEPVTLTAGDLDSEARYVYSSGQCLALAVAVAERTGWPVYLRMGHGYVGRRRQKCDYLIHAMVQDPAGRLIDVNGAVEEGGWVPSGDETAPQVVSAAQARTLLRTHTVGMPAQDVEVAASFVDPVLEQA